MFIVLCGGLLLLWFFFAGGASDLAALAAKGQQEIQRALASALRALKRGEPAAFMLLLGLCFSYGFLHAAGPGHGKMVLGGYAVASRETIQRLSIIALLSSLMQGAVAILLVLIGSFLLNLGRAELEIAAETIMLPASVAAIGMVGLWLVWRGIRHLGKQEVSSPDQSKHNHHHGCGSCNHKHGPELEEVERLSSFWEALMLITSIGIRPCTGAIFLLIITFSMGIPLAGIAGVLAMSIGTAIITISVASGAALWRNASTRLGGEAVLSRFAWLEIGFGLIVVAVSLSFLIERFT